MEGDVERIKRQMREALENTLEASWCGQRYDIMFDAEEWRRMSEEERAESVRIDYLQLLDEAETEIEIGTATEAELEARDRVYEAIRIKADAIIEEHRRAGWDLESFKRAMTGSIYISFSRGDEEKRVRVSDHEGSRGGGMVWSPACETMVQAGDPDEEIVI